MTEAMKTALHWLRAHGGDGVKARFKASKPSGVCILAAGETGMFDFSTWKRLVAAGHCEWYADGKRIRVTTKD